MNDDTIRQHAASVIAMDGEHEEDAALIEAMARGIADSDYREQVAANVRAGRSMPGPFDGLDYKLSAAQWDATGPSMVKDAYRVQARAGLAAQRAYMREQVDL